MARIARCILITTTVISLTLSVFGANSPEKEALLDEAMKVIEADYLTIRVLDAMFTGMLAGMETDEEMLAGMSSEDQENWRKQNEEMRRQQEMFREKLFAHLDGGEIAENIIRPLFDETYSEEELERVLAFFRSDAGTKTVQILPDMTIGLMFRSQDLLEDAIMSAQREMVEEERAKTPPWQRTMGDMRSIATASEAYAIDNDMYPEANDLDDLDGLLSPIYIRELPRADAWGRDYRYLVSDDLTSYRIVSAGPDGTFSWDSDIRLDDAQLGRAAQPSTSFNDDLVYQNGTFIQYPPESQMEN